MDWANIFISVIFLGVLIRLAFLFAGPLTFDDKISKASNWLIGLVLLALSWGILNVIWGNKGGGLFKGSSSTPNNKGFFDKQDNPKPENPNSEVDKTEIIINK